MHLLRNKARFNNCRALPATSPHSFLRSLSPIKGLHHGAATWGLAHKSLTSHSPVPVNRMVTILNPKKLGHAQQQRVHSRPEDKRATVGRRGLPLGAFGMRYLPLCGLVWFVVEPNLANLLVCLVRIFSTWFSERSSFVDDFKSGKSLRWFVERFPD